MNEYISKNQLEVGAVYRCKARNFTEGTWNGKEFEYMRVKFGWEFPDKEYHWDDDGTVKPLEKIEKGDKKS